MKLYLVMMFGTTVRNVQLSNKTPWVMLELEYGLGRLETLV